MFDERDDVGAFVREVADVFGGLFEVGGLS